VLRITDLTYRIAGRVLFEGASARVPAGHRVGLVGRNGSGKSTLLRLIAGEIEPDGGTITVPRGARVATVAQEAPGGETGLRDWVLAADRERARLMVEAEDAPAAERIAEIHTRLADLGAHAAPARAAAILAGLGFDDAAQARPLSAFSGGWRMRVALAATLFLEPDILLLDEPTNYLDLEGTLWLEGYLRAYPRTVIVASHDRALLNGAVGAILHLEGGKLVSYAGGYDAFVRARAERQAHSAALAAKQEAARRHMQAFVDRFRYKASKARQAQSRLKALARMAPVAIVAENGETRFRFPEPRPLPPPLLTLDGVAVGYAPGRPVLRGLDLRIDMGDRIALIGANGNGKSTLAKLLAGRLEAAAGTLTRAARLVVGYFAQHQIDELDAGASATAHMARVMPGASETARRARLGAFGLEGEKASVSAAALSGGERARLVLALISHAAPQLLVLDEPTNHLDADAREALVRALLDYPGAVVLITHDRHLIEACAEALWLVAEGGVRRFDGDLDDYRRLLATARPATGDARRRRRKADRRGALAGLRRAVRSAEAELARLAAEKAEIDRALAEPAIHVTDRLARLARRRAAIEAAETAAEATWIEAAAALENAGG